MLADRIDPKVLEFAKSETPEDDVYEYYTALSFKV